MSLAFLPLSPWRQVKLQAGNSQMTDWTPIVFVTFKVLIFGTCMFFAIKWHYDQGK